MAGVIEFAMADYKYKRITLFAGHYGSGKTNIAVNFALRMRAEGKAVKIADLDIVNPYFRTKDSMRELSEAGVELISPSFANTNVDLPALPQEVYSIFHHPDTYAVLDVGGDDRGAYALGRYTPYILEEGDYEMIYVANFYRPLTTTVEDTIEVMREIESACGIRFTSIINNSNLGNITTADTINATIDRADRLSAMTGLPLIFTTVVDTEGVNAPNLMKLNLQEKYFDIKEN